MTKTLVRSSLLVVVAVVTAACGTVPAVPHADGSAPVAVTVAPVVRVSRPAVIEAGGTLHGQRAVVVASRVMGPVVAVPVMAGDRVRAGQVLVQIDDAAAAADVRSAAAARVAADRQYARAQAEASAAASAATLARATHARIAALAARRSATAQELDAALAALDAAEAQVAAADAGVAAADAARTRAVAGGDGARAVAAWARVTAPFAGLVTETFVEPGAMAAPGSALVRVEDTAAFEVDVRLDESRAHWARPGDTVTVLVDVAGGIDERQGRITEVGRAAGVDTRAVTVTVTLETADGLRSGMFARVRLPGPAREAIVVPPSAVVRRGQLTSVFVVEGTTARMRLVRVAAADATGIEIVAGLAEGEQIVVSPAATLRDGGDVHVSAQEATGEAPIVRGDRS